MTKNSPGGPSHPGVKPATRFVTGGRDPQAFHGFVNPPVVHASTVLYPTVDAYEARRGLYTYGRRGTPTSEAFSRALAEIEGPQCAGVALLPSGLAAASLALQSVLQSGDHVLVTDNVYGPTRKFCDTVLNRCGVTTSYFDPLVSDITPLMQPNTRAVYLESPGSLSFEVQDVPAIAQAAHARGAVVLIDNTWASPLYFRALEKGVDLSVQSGSKYIGGHSDLMLGAIAANAKCWPQLNQTVFSMGLCVGPDDMYLGMRGLRTMAVRLAQHYQAGLKVARWFAQRPEVRDGPAPGARELSRPCDLEARLHRRLRPVQHRAQAGAAESGARLHRCADAVRHRRVVGRIREPGDSVRLRRRAQRHHLVAGRAGGALPYRARGRGRSDCRPRTRLCRAGGGALKPHPLVPAQAGTQGAKKKILDARFRGHERRKFR